MVQPQFTRPWWLNLVKRLKVFKNGMKIIPTLTFVESKYLIHSVHRDLWNKLSDTLDIDAIMLTNNTLCCICSAIWRKNFVFTGHDLGSGKKSARWQDKKCNKKK